MSRLLLIIFCHLSIYCAFVICNKINPIDDNAFDLDRHTGYYLTIIAATMFVFSMPGKYESWVKFLAFTFIWGTLVNCIIFNLQGDRDFHWYSVAFIAFSINGGILKGWPLPHKKFWLKFIKEKYYNYIHAL